MKDQLEKIEKRLACIEENTRLLLLSDVMRELDKSTDILEDKLLSEWLEQQRMTMEKLDTVNGQNDFSVDMLNGEQAKCVMKYCE